MIKVLPDKMRQNSSRYDKGTKKIYVAYLKSIKGRNRRKK